MHSCVFFFVAPWYCRPLGMINPEELYIEREEEIAERRMRGRERVKEQGIEDVGVFHGESTLYLCTSSRVHRRLAVCLLINHAL